MESPNVTAARAFLDAIIPGDRETIRGVLRDDAVFHLPRPSFGTPLEGGDTIATALASFSHAEYSEAAGEYGWIVDGGDRVVIEWSVHATVRSSGAPHVNFYCWMFQLDGGLIAEIREFADTAVAHAAAGEVVQQVLSDVTGAAGDAPRG